MQDRGGGMRILGTTFGRSFSLHFNKSHVSSQSSQLHNPGYRSLIIGEIAPLTSAAVATIVMGMAMLSMTAASAKRVLCRNVVPDCLRLKMANSVVTSTRYERKNGGTTKDMTVEADCSQKILKPGQDPSTSEVPHRKKRRLHTYERARLAYERIQAERRAEVERRRAEREGRERALQSYLSTKRKMDKVLLKRNRKGQPKLNAQIEVLLEKIEKRMRD